MRRVATQERCTSGRRYWQSVPGAATFRVRIARLYAHAGENDQAMEWLQRAFEQRETPLMHLSIAWDWDGLRDDPRFRDLLRRVGLPE